MPLDRLTTDDLRRLANINLRAISNTCLLLSELDANTYMDYVLTGLTAFKRGLNNEPEERDL